MNYHFFTKTLFFFFFMSCSVSIIEKSDWPVAHVQTPTKLSDVVKDKIKNEEIEMAESVESKDPLLQKYCDQMDGHFKKYSWPKSECQKYSWIYYRKSHLGYPIAWVLFGNEPANEMDATQSLASQLDGNTTLIFCGVHGDEITPTKFCFDVMEEIQEKLRNNDPLVKDKTIVVAPLVTPDSFFINKPTRVNARGVDVNRNFPTKDWSTQALSLWRTKYKSDPRRFPGVTSLSEQETRFQINLIKRYRPAKIISVHAPLSLLDYDGPSLKNHHLGNQAGDLLIQMSDKAGQYRVSNYPIFPGSLGNWAGNENHIPTYTLELPTIDSRKSAEYYQIFREAIFHAIDKKLYPDGKGLAPAHDHHD